MELASQHLLPTVCSYERIPVVRSNPMRRLIIGSLAVLLTGCNLNAPSGVKVILNSDKILDVQQFEYESSEIGGVSSCSVSGSIQYDITFEPSNFTGAVSFHNLVLEYAGKWRSEPQTAYLDVLNGKLMKGTGINIYQSVSYEDGPKEKKEAVCASKSSSDIKIASLGEPVLVFPGLKASTKIVSGTNAAP